MLTTRDKAIIDDLNRFRCMSRDDIADLHFKGLKNPKYAANNILLRLHREKYIERSTCFIPYVYFGSDVNVKKNSAKIGHFLAIVQVYKEILLHGNLELFYVEPKFGTKGTVEPDIFCIIRKTPFFIEVQKSIYSEKQMKDKLDRYLELYNSKTIEKEPWQPAEKKVFPQVLILSDQHYALEAYPFTIRQYPSYTHLLQTIKPKEESKPEIQINSTETNLKLKTN